MIRLSPPNFSFLESYQSCLNEITSNNDVKRRMENIIPHILNNEQLYQHRARNGELHLFEPTNRGHLENPIIENVTKNDFVNLYKKYFSIKNKSSRELYDKIKASTEICPLCMIGIVKTLDHYLPKAYYPIFSVHPQNLVPVCRDCNTEKSSSIFNSSEELPLHPYFLEECFLTENWINAEISQTSPPCCHFYLSTPEHWTNILKERAKNHFEHFEIAKKYAIKAAELLPMFTKQVNFFLEKSIFLPSQIQEYFYGITPEQQEPNNITRILLTAIANNEWFCSTQH